MELAQAVRMRQEVLGEESVFAFVTLAYQTQTQLHHRLSNANSPNASIATVDLQAPLHHHITIQATIVRLRKLRAWPQIFTDVFESQAYLLDVPRL
jgi:citrate lyase synthetase